MEWVSVAEKIWRDVRSSRPRRNSLPLKNRICFGIGHVFNDLCAYAWYTYLLIYFHQVVGLSSTKTGYLFVIAYFVDAVMTPFISIGCERSSVPCLDFYGEKKSWHLLGSLLVTFTWPFLFSPCVSCDESSTQSVIFNHYAAVIVFLQIGWVMVQISHLSLVPVIAKTDKHVLELNAIRSVFSFVCGVFVFCVTWILVGQINEQAITRAMDKKFTTLAVIITAFGFVSSVVFHWGTKEPYPEPRHTRNDSLRETEELNSEDRDNVSETSVLASVYSERDPANRSWRQWFSDRDFYKMAVVHTCTRVAVNVAQMYLLFYVTDTLLYDKESVAYFPLVILTTGAIANAVSHKINGTIGNKWSYCVASIVVLVACMWLQLQSLSNKNAVFVATIMMGSGISTLLATSLSMTADLVTKDKESSGMVYSAMRLCDRGIVALVVLIIQINYPESQTGVHLPACGDYARLVFTLAPSVAVIVALLTVLLTFDSGIDINCTEKVNRQDGGTQTVITFQSSRSHDSLCLVHDDEDELTIGASTPSGLPVLNNNLGEPLDKPRDLYAKVDPGPRAAYSAPEAVASAPLQAALRPEDDFSMNSLTGPDTEVDEMYQPEDEYARDSASGRNSEVEENVIEKKDNDNEKSDVYRHISSMPSTYI